MKIKQIIIAGLLLSGLTGLIAGVLAKNFRGRFLTSTEQCVLGITPEEDNIKTRCYLETRLAFAQGAAMDPSDPILREFYPNGAFDELYNDQDNLTGLIRKLFVLEENFSDATELRAKKLLLLWFMREILDESCDLANSLLTLNNMLVFWLSNETIYKTLRKADQWLMKEGYGGFGCENLYTAMWPTAFSCIDDPDCLDYPACFANIIQREND